MPTLTQPNFRRFFVLCATALALTGCGSPAARIAGNVTHNGQAVRGAEVVVETAASPAEQYFGMTTDDGSLYVGYRDKPGVPPGAVKIRVTHYTLRNGQPLPVGEAGQALRASDQTLVKTYVFDQELVNGKNTLELKLESAASVADAPPR
jgi:hypothetical protein